MALAKVASRGSFDDGAFATAHNLTVSGITAGNLLVVRGLIVLDTVTVTITDNHSNSYSTTNYTTNSGDSLTVFMGLSIVGTAPTQITVTTSAGDPCYFTVDEFSGNATSSFLDGTAQTIGLNFADNPWVGPALTNTNANDLLLGIMGGSGTGYTGTPGTGWTEETDLDPTNNTKHVYTQYMIVSSTGTYTPHMTLSTGNDGGAAIFAMVKAAGGSGASVTAVPAQATGDVVNPTLGAGSRVTSPAASATGAVPPPGVSGSGTQGATVTAVPAAGAGAAPAPAVTAPDGRVTPPAASATGAMPISNLPISFEVDPGPESATGAVPAPTITGGTGGGVGAELDPAPAQATGDVVNPTMAATASLHAVPAAGAGQDLRPQITPPPSGNAYVSIAATFAQGF